MFKKILKVIDNLILKYHKCKNYAEIYSKNWKTMNDITICTDIVYVCSICNKKVMH